jgi:hypothetical protein
MPANTSLQPKKISDVSILWWIKDNNIKNEKGEPIDFYNHPYLFDIYRDRAADLTVMKAAQVGMSTCEILRNHYDAKYQKMDIIYTLPTDNDVSIFVGGKVNRIIANNPCMLKDVKDKDSIEQKAVGDSMIYFRGTFTKKAAIMVTADRLSHDEKDSSKFDVINDFQARLQHSKHKQTHTFSHPDIPETGVHADWMDSDQKHWFVKCPHCTHWQFLSWDIENPKKMSIDIERKVFICKKCQGTLSDDVRRTGQWVAKHPERKRSGYWVSLLIVPTVSAAEITNKFQKKDTTPWFFNTRVLGLPHSDGQSKLLKEHFMQNLTGSPYAAEKDDRVIIGVDTGLRLDYVMGNAKGLFFHADADDYADLDVLMERYPKAIVIMDAGGDLIGSRKFYEKWKGRVFLCYLMGDKKQNELVTWGEGDSHGQVRVERNRMIGLVVGEFRNKLIPIHGTEGDWYEYYNDWSNLSRIKILDPDTNEVKGYKWVRSARDHRALATVLWRVGMTRFAGKGSIIAAPTEARPNSYMVNPVDNTASFDPNKLFDHLEEQRENDWRA